MSFIPLEVKDSSLRLYDCHHVGRWARRKKSGVYLWAVNETLELNVASRKKQRSGIASHCEQLW
jgi:hypothetical protein